jgi:hypothetical protein
LKGVAPQTSLRQNILEELYIKNYEQTIHRRDRTNRHFDIRTKLELIKPTIDEHGKIILQMDNIESGQQERHGPYDLVISASGYVDCSYSKILPLLKPLSISYGKTVTDEGYRVLLNPDNVSKDCNVWIVGAPDHAALDAFPILAARSGQVVRSLQKVFFGASPKRPFYGSTERVPQMGNVRS